MAAVGALETGESGGKVAAAVELVDHRHGIPAQRAMSPAMAGFIVGDEFVPGVVDDLPKGRGARTAGPIDGRYKCFFEHFTFLLSTLFT